MPKQVISARRRIWLLAVAAVVSLMVVTGNTATASAQEPECITIRTNVDTEVFIRCPGLPPIDIIIFGEPEPVTP